MTRGRKSYVWNAERRHFIRQHAGEMTDDILAGEMTRRFGYKFSIAAVRLQRRALGIQKENGRGRCKIKKQN